VILLVELPSFERYPSPSKIRLESVSSIYTSPIKREPLTWVSNDHDSVEFGRIIGKLVSVPVEFVPGIVPLTGISIPVEFVLGIVPLTGIVPVDFGPGLQEIQPLSA